MVSPRNPLSRAHGFFTRCTERSVQRPRQTSRNLFESRNKSNPSHLTPSGWQLSAAAFVGPVPNPTRTGASHPFRCVDSPYLDSPVCWICLKPRCQEVTPHGDIETRHPTFVRLDLALQHGQNPFAQQEEAGSCHPHPAIDRPHTTIGPRHWNTDEAWLQKRCWAIDIQQGHGSRSAILPSSSNIIWCLKNRRPESINKNTGSNLASTKVRDSPSEVRGTPSGVRCCVS